MAKRTVYYVDQSNEPKQKEINFTWYPGFALVQKQKSIKSLHENFVKENANYKIIEISSSSTEPCGAAASAFNLKMKTKHGIYTVEQLFQSGKVFEKAGKQSQILNMTPSESRRANKRISKDDQLISFNLFGETFPLDPKTYFYNWIYLNALNQNNDIKKAILEYDAFTDINATPKYTINTQAEACSLFVSLYRKGTLQSVLKDKKVLFNVLGGSHHDKPQQTSLF